MSLERLAQLEAELAALPDDAVFQLALDANRHARARLDAQIETIRFANNALANVAPQLETAIARFDQFTTFRKALCDELLGCPRQPRTDVERGRIQNLELSIQVIDRGPGMLTDTGWSLNTLRLGQLMRDAGYVEGPRIENQAYGPLPWFGSLPALEREVAALERSRSDAQARLDSVLREMDPAITGVAQSMTGVGTTQSVGEVSATS